MHRTDCCWFPAILMPQDTHDWENCFAELMFSQENESLQWAVTDKTVQLQVMTESNFLAVCGLYAFFSISTIRSAYPVTSSSPE